MSMTLRARNDIHLARRLWHFGGVATIATLDWWLSRPAALTLAISATVLLVGIDVTRLMVPSLNRFFTFLMRPFMRESERHRPAGISFMMVGATLTIILFPKSVTLLSLWLFSVADPLASYFGVRFGTDKITGQKTFQGALAAFVSGVVVAVLYCHYADLMRERLFIVAWLTGLITAASELMPVGRLDDNFVFPLMSASLLSGLFYVFGGF